MIECPSVAGSRISEYWVEAQPPLAKIPLELVLEPSTQLGQWSIPWVRTNNRGLPSQSQRVKRRWRVAIWQKSEEKSVE